MRAFEHIALSDEEFQLFRDYIYNVSGIELTDKKKDMLKARLNKRISDRGISSYYEYFKIVSNNSEETRALLDAISTNLTFFFRESRHFQFLEERVIPELIRKDNNSIRIWSAGCSSGEEAYSIAIIFLLNVRNLDRLDIKILATDISDEILQQGQLGQYSATDLQNIESQIINRYFEKYYENDNQKYQISEEVKRLVKFKRLNLMQPLFPFKGEFDLIFCRNVMIYFEKIKRERLVNKYYDLLKEGGYLFIGHSESLIPVNHKFQNIEPTIYKKV
ncbi:MAG: CheR family methyltransferase [Nitrospinota bacterium]